MKVDELITKKDLEKFKEEIISEIKLLLEQNIHPKKKWLKMQDVRKMLNVSAGTLQTLRNNGTLPFKKLGGIIYYDADDINNLLKTDYLNGKKEA